MEDNKFHLINKIFNSETIRTVWDKDLEKYYVSVVDVVTVLNESTYQEARNYWKVLKNRLKKEGNETVTNCNQLRLKANDGKYRLTDVADIEGILRLIESIPSPKAEPFKLWLAGLGSERMNEVFDPEIAINRAINYYQNKGYSEEWIKKRLLRQFQIRIR